jgi:hypothetical protein
MPAVATGRGKELWTYTKQNFAKIAEDIGALGIRVEKPAETVGRATADPCLRLQSGLMANMNRSDPLQEMSFFLPSGPPAPTSTTTAVSCREGGLF